MKIQGDLNPSSLAELFKNLSDQRATGILSVYSPMGEKHIALARGEVTIYSDRLSERTRIGDLLAARGKISEEKLEEALRVQRSLSQRTQLGTMLVEKGFVSKDDINEAVKFQLEEEICDLFTFRNATFEFDSSRRTEELEGEFSSDEGGAAFVHRLSIDPQALILEASRRIDDWKIFEERLPSPYLCFRISAKGEEMKSKGSPQTQRLIKLLREGRTLETVVKLSCLGRFNAYKQIIRFLDDGWIVPCPASDLKFMASEHRSQERYADALYLYRRLLEMADDDLEKKELETLIEDTVESILRAQAAGRRPEGAEIVSHKGAAAAYKRRQRIFRILLGASALIAIVASFWFWLNSRRRDPPPEAYRTAMEQVDVALSEERYEDAILIWHKFYVSHCDPESELGKLVHARLDGLYAKYNRQVEFLHAQAKFLEESGKFDEAEATYQKLMKECPENRYADEIEKDLENLKDKRAAIRARETMEVWKVKLAAALDLEKRKLYDQAREALLKTSEGSPAGSEVRRQAEEGLARIQAVSGRIRDQYQIGIDRLREMKANKALEAYDAACAEWPENEWAQKARQEAVALRARQQRIREDLAAAKAAEGRGESSDALATYERLSREYGEFEEVQELGPRIEQLAAKLQNAGTLLAQAQAAQKAGKTDQAREIYAQMLRAHRRFLTQQKAQIPVTITSTPSGAAVFVEGKPLGKTPLLADLPADEEIAIQLALPGFEEQKRTLRRLMPDDLTMNFRLERAPVAVLDFPEPVLAPPVLLGGRLVVVHGGSVAAVEPGGGRVLWTSRKLVDEATAKNYELERLQIGTQDSWWHLQTAPFGMGGGRMGIVTQLREVYTLAEDGGAATLLAKLPAEPLGAPRVIRGGLVAGRVTLAIAFADGQLRVYDTSTPKTPMWEHAIDEKGAPDHLPVSGVLHAGAGQIATVSHGGTVTVWDTVSGKKRWSFKVSSEPAVAVGVEPDEDDGSSAPCAIITTKGTVVALDLARNQKLWELPATQPSDRAVSVAIGSKGVYVLNRDCTVCRYPLAASNAAPKPEYSKPLDDIGPSVCEAPSGLYAATNASHVYALLVDQPKEIWRYKCSGRPLHLAVIGKFVYVATSDAKLVVLNAE
ncbi:MAG: DUF4388 domain-containing protein [Planctomycetota bacterium]|nr:DUF4388 domain-containing protein [Planctomycetota bacterium]